MTLGHILAASLEDFISEALREDNYKIDAKTKRQIRYVLNITADFIDVMLETSKNLARLDNIKCDWDYILSKASQLEKAVTVAQVVETNNDDERGDGQIRDYIGIQPPK